MKKVCFTIYDMGAGHRSTANALKSVIESRNLPWQVEIVEVLKDVFGTTFPQDFYNRWTLKKKWAKLINDPISVPIFKLKIRLQKRMWQRRLQQYWREQQPDLVVSLMPLVNRILLESLRAELPHTPFITSITDFADCPPHFWIEPQEQLLICPSQRAANQAQAAGYPEKNLFQTSGVVIHPRFNEPITSDRQQARQALGLHPDLPTGLICFGSHGSKDMVEIAQRLEQSPLALQLVFVCGRNEALAQQLRHMPSRVPKVVEGFTRQLQHYMHLSDFFIGKPGSVGVSEAVAMGLPVITECDPVMTLFQERATANWLADNQFGLVVRNFRQIDQLVGWLLEPEIFQRYRDNVGAYRNRAVFEVVDILENRLEPARQPTPVLG
ncbi:MAG: UDP-N-acetylglucosamine--LPS N-acetylglucosamine transferase [Cyanobacteria bacterium P01_G01_bin.38]